MRYTTIFTLLISFIFITNTTYAVEKESAVSSHSIDFRDTGIFSTKGKNDITLIFDGLFDDSSNGFWIGYWDNLTGQKENNLADRNILFTVESGYFWKLNNRLYINSSASLKGNTELRRELIINTYYNYQPKYFTMTVALTLGITF